MERINGLPASEDNANITGGTIDGVDITGGTISGAVISDAPYATFSNPASSVAVATAVVDAYNGSIITLTSAGNAQTLENPTTTTAGKNFTVVNNDTSTDNIDVNSITLEPGEAQSFIWDGSAWIPVEAVDAADITFTPSGDLVAVNVQDAIDELDDEKVRAIGATMQAPAKVESFSGTISAVTRTATFAETADYSLCEVGSTLIADGDTRIVIALLGSDQVTVDADTTWSGVAITSLQDPISQEKDADGTVVKYVNALGGVGLLGGTGMQHGIAFGDGDTGFKASADGKITIDLNGVSRFYMDQYALSSNTSGGGRIAYSGASAAFPTVGPRQNDTDSGMGSAALDSISLIAGGVEGQRIVEANSIIYNLFGVTQLESVTDATTNGTTTVTKAGTNFTTKCAANNTVLFYDGTTTADYGLYTVVSVADGSLVLDRAPSGSVSDMDFYVLSGGLITTGGNLYADKSVHALLDIVTHSATENVTAATMKGSVHKITGAYVVTLPAAVIGMGGVFRASTAATFSVNPNNSDHFEMYDGTVLDAGDSIASGGTKNEFVQIYCESANTWIVVGINGAFTDAS